MKFNSQICTSREQSERLLALGLKAETADMHYSTDHRGNVRQLWLLAYGDLHEDVQVHSLPAWSLHRLVSALTNNGINITFIDNIVIIKQYKTFEKSYEFWDDVYDNICDAVEWLIKEGYFNKEYLEDKK